MWAMLAIASISRMSVWWNGQSQCVVYINHGTQLGTVKLSRWRHWLNFIQNERRSAPCGQIGAATQSPVLVTSPTLKNFCVARAFEVRWTCTCCHDRAVFVIAFTTFFSFQSFLCFVGEVGTTPPELRCGVPLERGLAFVFSLWGPLCAALDTLSFSTLPHQALPRCGHRFRQWMHCLCLQVRLGNIVHCIDRNPGQMLDQVTPDFPLDCPTGLQPISDSVDCHLALSDHSLNSRVPSAPASSNVLMTRWRSSSL